MRVAAVAVALALGCARAHVLTPTLELRANLFGNASVEVCEYAVADQASPMATSCTTVTTTTQSSAEVILGGVVGALGGWLAAGLPGA